MNSPFSLVQIILQSLQLYSVPSPFATNTSNIATLAVDFLLVVGWGRGVDRGVGFAAFFGLLVLPINLKALFRKDGGCFGKDWIPFSLSLEERWGTGE